LRVGGPISLDDFKRLDLRVAEIVSAERMAGSSRLLPIDVDLGTERRVVVAGLARHDAPESLQGLKVIFLANLEPALIHGVQPEGMLLGAACTGAAPALVTVNHPIANGTAVQ
jgi:methionyl-tRNA synthetase